MTLIGCILDLDLWTGISYSYCGVPYAVLENLVQSCPSNQAPFHSLEKGFSSQIIEPLPY